MQDCNVMQHNVIKEWYFQESDEFHTPDPMEGFHIEAVMMQVRRTDSVNDRKVKAKWLLFILLTQKPMWWEGAGERLGACRVAREQLYRSGHFKGEESTANCGSPRYHIAFGSIRVQAPLQDR